MSAAVSDERDRRHRWLYLRSLPGAATTAGAAKAAVQQQLMPDGPIDLHGQISPGGHTGAHCMCFAGDPSFKQCCRCGSCMKKHQRQQTPGAQQECSAFMPDLCAETQSNTVTRPMVFKAPMCVFYLKPFFLTDKWGACWGHALRHAFGSLARVLFSELGWCCWDLCGNVQPLVGSFVGVVAWRGCGWRWCQRRPRLSRAS